MRCDDVARRAMERTRSGKANRAETTTTKTAENPDGRRRNVTHRRDNIKYPESWMSVRRRESKSTTKINDENDATRI
jgi:hypothetical protein